MHKEIIDKVARILVIIGAVNWGLFGVKGWDLVNMVVGSIPMVAKAIYVLVGLSGLYMVYDMFK